MTFFSRTFPVALILLVSLAIASALPSAKGGNVLKRVEAAHAAVDEGDTVEEVPEQDSLESGVPSDPPVVDNADDAQPPPDGPDAALEEGEVAAPSVTDKGSSDKK